MKSMNSISLSKPRSIHYSNLQQTMTKLFQILMIFLYVRMTASFSTSITRSQYACCKPSFTALHVSSDEEEVTEGQNNAASDEMKKRRAAASLLQNIKSSSLSPSSRQTRKSISASMQMREQRETSVGKRRIGSASRARKGVKGVGKLIDAVKISAIGAGASKIDDDGENENDD